MTMRNESTELGVCQWFHYGACEDLERAIDGLRELGVRHVRTGISWADYHRPGGRAWIDHQMNALAEFEVLLSVWHTPPSLSESGTTSGPPRRLRDYADFIDLVIQRWGDRFTALELWNEPNNRYKWDFVRHDPQWDKLGRMLAMAAYWAQRCDVRTVLGGMSPVDPAWLRLMKRHGVLEHVDVVAIHAFPHMWWDDAPCWDQRDDWHGWPAKIQAITAAAEGRPVWVTETGLATWDPEQAVRTRTELQCRALRAAARAPVPRVYWYSLLDLDPTRSAIEGFHVDENEYHLGLVRRDGTRKPAWDYVKDLFTAVRGATAADTGIVRSAPRANQR